MVEESKGTAPTSNSYSMTPREYIGGSVHGLVQRVSLLRAHVFRRSHELAELGEHGLIGAALVDRLGDAEVDHLGDGAAVDLLHQHICGLQIAVDDALLMGVLHGFADGQEELEALARIEAAIVAIFRDGDAVDVLHHEKWAPVRGDVGVEDAGDVGMVHHRERLPLIGEARQDMAAVHADLDHFEGHHAADGRGLFGAVNGAHAAFAQHALDLIIAKVVGVGGTRLPGGSLEGDGRHGHADGRHLRRSALHADSIGSSSAALWTKLGRLHRLFR